MELLDLVGLGQSLAVKGEEGRSGDEEERMLFAQRHQRKLVVRAIPFADNITAPWG